MNLEPDVSDIRRDLDQLKKDVAEVKEDLKQLKKQASGVRYARDPRLDLIGPGARVDYKRSPHYAPFS